MITRKAMIRISVVCTMLPVAIVLGFWFVGGMLIAPMNREVGPPPDDLAFESIVIPSKSASQLASWYLPAANSHATVVFVHGIGADRRQMLGLARILHGEGFAVLLIDLRAHGESPGDAITLGHLERFDVQAAVDYARQREPAHRIGLVGRSMGGAAALLAPKLDLDALVTESVYASIDDAIANRVGWFKPLLLWQLGPRAGITADELRPIDRIGDIGCPVCVVTGGADRLTPLAESQRLVDAAHAPKEFVVFEQAGHEDFLAHDPVLYRTRVVKFLTEHLDAAGEASDSASDAATEPASP
jgi:alpha-beta hydrolase superfamily lysophospholipase